MIGLSEIVPCAINFLTKEYIEEIREYLYICGVNPFIYWFSTLLCETIPFIISYYIILIIY